MVIRVNKILINVHQNEDWSIITVNQGFINFDDKMYPSRWLNKKQFRISNKVLMDYIQLFKDQNSEIFFRFNKECSWIPYTNQKFVWDDVMNFLRVCYLCVPQKRKTCSTFVLNIHTLSASCNCS